MLTKNLKYFRKRTAKALCANQSTINNNNNNNNINSRVEENSCDIMKTLALENLTSNLLNVKNDSTIDKPIEPKIKLLYSPSIVSNEKPKSCIPNNEKCDCNNNTCNKCAEKIVDSYLLGVDGHVYHAKCLSCNSCNISLQDQLSCYCKYDKIYCKLCYSQ